MFIPNNQVESKLSIPHKVATKTSVATPSKIETVDSFEEEFPSASIESEDVAMNNRLLMMLDMMSVDRTKIKQLTAEIEKKTKMKSMHALLNFLRPSFLSKRKNLVATFTKGSLLTLSRL